MKRFEDLKIKDDIYSVSGKGVIRSYVLYGIVVESDSQVDLYLSDYGRVSASPAGRYFKDKRNEYWWSASYEGAVEIRNMNKEAIVEQSIMEVRKICKHIKRLMGDNERAIVRIKDLFQMVEHDNKNEKV